MAAGRKVVAQCSNDAIHMHVDGPTLADDKSYQEIVRLMGWGDMPIPNLPMSTIGIPPTLFPQSYVPTPSVRSRKSPLHAASVPVRDPITPESPNTRPTKRRVRDRGHHLPGDSECYPSSSSSSDLPSPRKVLAMLPETAKAPGRFKGKRKTAWPTYKNSIWPREKACCVHTCGDTSMAIPSSDLYSVAQVLAVRSFWYELTTSDRRQFIANRMEEVNTGGATPTRRYYMDTPAVISHGLTLAASARVICVCVCVCVGGLVLSLK